MLEKSVCIDDDAMVLCYVQSSISSSMGQQRVLLAVVVNPTRKVLASSFRPPTWKFPNMRDVRKIRLKMGRS